MGLTGVVPTTELHRLAYNALQYSGKDTSVKGVTMWVRSHDVVMVVAYDDYFAISDMISGLADAKNQFERGFMELVDLQKLEKYLRDVTSPDYSLSELVLNDQFFGAKTLQQAAEVIEGLYSGYLSEGTLDVFAVSPDRLRRLSLLKPKGYPLDFRAAYDVDQDQQVLLFRYGPTAEGAIAPLNRDTLKEMFKGDELW